MTLRALLIEDQQLHAACQKYTLEDFSSPDPSREKGWLEVEYVLTAPTDLAVYRRYDFVLCDYWMGGVNGLELCRAIHAYYPDKPVGLLTNFEQAAIPFTCSDHIQYFNKFDLAEVMRQIKPWLIGYGLLDKDAYVPRRLL